MNQGRSLAVCSSERKGEGHKNIGNGLQIKNFALQGDLPGGDFAGNLTIIDINLPALPIGTHLCVGVVAAEEL